MPNEAGAPAESYLHLLLQVTEDGELSVLSASQVEGRLILSEYPLGPFHVEVRRGGAIVAVESILDPFAAHGFGGPPGSGQEIHSQMHQAKASLAVKIPDASLDDPRLDQISITLYRRRDPGVALERIDPPTQARLLEEGRLEEVASLPGKELAKQIHGLKGE
jgi:hypothetical protein